MKDSITSYTITCSRPTNYGAVLQTYGLNTALRKMGVDAKVLDYNPKYYYTSTRPLPIRMLRAIVRFPDLVKGRKVFGKFLEDYIPMSAKTYRTLAEIEADTPNPTSIFVAATKFGTVRTSLMVKMMRSSCHLCLRALAK